MALGLLVAALGLLAWLLCGGPVATAGVVPVGGEAVETAHTLLVAPLAVGDPYRRSGCCTGRSSSGPCTAAAGGP